MDKKQEISSESKPLREGIDFYWENGFFVFTEAYHLRRGYCCKSGCRHCPYGFLKRFKRREPEKP